MTDLNQTHGVAGLKKYDMKVSGIVFMIYCLVAAGAFGIEEMIPASGPGLTILMLLIFPIVWALPISNMVAELGAEAAAAGAVSPDGVEVGNILFDMEAKVVRSQILDGEPRIDGRD
ncbi:MAG: hypothetical protein RR361_02400, partial [Anaerovorax sp.]